ncbi:hypothetical protein [Leptothoe sp. PORK10 BA2]|uniref:hypothetical protein n=1 Tax=Leptothoe sp. PORK10 BA2 TaxID=3110254 RepID=UPI002B2102AD|nr:hypothetical protein [Leptothoe sp. PORK10 BA2]MEA5464062.1 hypothetical protein [Leptothoe sp. PORK10 BA2]
MPFTIRTEDALAMQEDEAQLLMAIGQITQRLYATLQRQTQQPPGPIEDSLRIQMGRRVVYGTLADGTQRRELTPNTLKVIVDALQRPVTPDSDPKEYEGKVPNIEIRDQGQVLFREERDGTVTVNQIQLTLEQESSEPEPIAEPVVEEPLPASTPITSDLANDVAVAAQQLLNPLGQEVPTYNAVAVGQYTIQQQGDLLLVSREEDVILSARQGTILDEQVTQVDWQTFHDITERMRVEQLGERHEPVTAEQTPTKDSPPALAVLDREIAKIPHEQTRQTLQVTATDWKQQVKTQVKQGALWLARQPQVLRDQRLAYAVLGLFHRSYGRTGEHHYRLGNYQLSFKGTNLYTLRDSQGVLMQFQAFRQLGLGPRIKLLEVSDRLSDFQRQDLISLKRDQRVMPQGALDVEANYAAKTDRVERTVRGFLRNVARAHCWDKDGGHFKLEMGAGNLLRITDKRQGRGVVFQRQAGEVFSKLGPKDFSHFDRLAQRMQSTQMQPSVSAIKPVVSQQMEMG